jgi:hypothetical protein
MVVLEGYMGAFCIAPLPSSYYCFVDVVGNTNSDKNSAVNSARLVVFDFL